MRAEEINGRFFDLVYVRDGEREYRMMFPLNSKIDSLGPQFKDHGLTQRELEIVSLAVIGMSNERICERLGVTHNTLRTHLKSIHRKLPRSARKLLGQRY